MRPENSSRSIAAELALLFLRELEPRVAEDPERLVSTEVVLSFAAVRRQDPCTWQHWRRILEKLEKADLVEHRFGGTLPSDIGGGSAADRLIGLALDSGIEFFHDPDQHGWASVRVDGHFENHPIRSRPFQLFLLGTYYRETGNSPGAQAIRAALELFEAKALFDGEEAHINLRVANHRGKLYLDLCDRAQAGPAGGCLQFMGGQSWHLSRRCSPCATRSLTRRNRLGDARIAVEIE